MKKIIVPILNIETFAKEGDVEDEKRAIVEAVIAFCIAAEKHGNGIEEEIKMLM
jgi:hypothetical protein